MSTGSDSAPPQLPYIWFGLAMLQTPQLSPKTVAEPGCLPRWRETVLYLYTIPCDKSCVKCR